MKTKTTEFKVGGDGKSYALELFKKKYRIEVTNDAKYGAFVTSVEGRKAEEKNAFWSLIVKDQRTKEETFSELGVSSLKARNGEDVILRLCKIQ